MGSLWLGKAIPKILRGFQTRGTIDKQMEPGLLVRHYLSSRGKACHTNTPDKDPEGDDDKESPIKQLIRILWTSLPYGPEFQQSVSTAFERIGAVDLMTVLLKYSLSACGN